MAFEVSGRWLEKKRDRTLGLETVDATDEDREIFTAAENEFMSRRPDKDWKAKYRKSGQTIG